MRADELHFIKKGNPVPDQPKVIIVLIRCFKVFFARKMRG